MMTAKTVRKPAPAPSAASLIARQLASLVTRTGRPMAAARSWSSGLPFSAWVFALRTSPVTGLRLPGMPTPMLPCAPASRSAAPTSAVMASIVSA